MKNYFFHRLNSFFLALWLVLGAHAAELGGSVTSAATPADSGLADFVHDTCVFDSCYDTYMRAGRMFHPRSYDNVGRANTENGVYVYYKPMFRSPFQFEGINRRMMRLRRVQRDLYASGGFDEAAERRKLAAQLRAFGDTADYVPLVYATIHTEYGGDITRYVDDLFRRSAMTNRRRMKRVARWPRKKRLQSDMGFQLSLSKQLYRAWEQMDRPTQLIGHFVIPNQWKK